MIPKEKVLAFSTLITEEKRPNEICVVKGTEIARECKKLCRAKGI